jgi:hypothetical protein
MFKLSITFVTTSLISAPIRITSSSSTVLEGVEIYRTRNIQSLSSFKIKLNEDVDKSPSFYSIGSRSLNIWHCQLRNEASSLNHYNQIQRKGKFIESCESSTTSNEMVNSIEYLSILILT